MKKIVSRFSGMSNEEVLIEGRKMVKAIQDETSKVVYGPELKALIDIMIMALLADGHVVVRAPVGMAKTLACNALAQTIGGTFNKRQFRPDMMAHEISGVNTYNLKKQEYEVHHGPLFGANIFLADEINRSTPKAQSALLEAMEERYVTVDKGVFNLQPVFMVLATRNPIEHEGTYELPEAEMDRFFAQPSIDEISEETGMKILGDPDFWRKASFRLENRIKPVATPEDIVKLREVIFSDIHVEQRLDRYLWRLRAETHQHKLVKVGSSPRGPINLKKAVKIAAFLSQRNYAVPVFKEDLTENLFVNIMAHRIFLKQEARYNSENPTSAADVAREVFRGVKYD